MASGPSSLEHAAVKVPVLENLAWMQVAPSAYVSAEHRWMHIPRYATTSYSQKDSLETVERPGDLQAAAHSPSSLGPA